MNVKLTRHSEQLLGEHLARAPSHTLEEVIEHALESLDETERPSQPPVRANQEEFRAFLDARKAQNTSLRYIPARFRARASTRT